MRANALPLSRKESKGLVKVRVLQVSQHFSRAILCNSLLLLHFFEHGPIVDVPLCINDNGIIEWVVLEGLGVN